MHACGMFIFSTPWQLDEKLNFCLPQILKILKKSEAANFEVKWIKNS
jgi:23S rRNA A2030 N6-methylase RlmJ